MDTLPATREIMVTSLLEDTEAVAPAAWARFGDPTSPKSSTELTSPTVRFAIFSIRAPLLVRYCPTIYYGPTRINTCNRRACFPLKVTGDSVSILHSLQGESSRP